MFRLTELKTFAWSVSWMLIPFWLIHWRLTPRAGRPVSLFRNSQLKFTAVSFGLNGNNKQETTIIRTRWVIPLGRETVIKLKNITHLEATKEHGAKFFECNDSIIKKKLKKFHFLLLSARWETVKISLDTHNHERILWLYNFFVNLCIYNYVL